MASRGMNSSAMKVSLRPSATITMKPEETSLPVPAVVGTATSGAMAPTLPRATPA